MAAHWIHVVALSVFLAACGGGGGGDSGDAGGAPPQESPAGGDSPPSSPGTPAPPPDSSGGDGGSGGGNDGSGNDDGGDAPPDFSARLIAAPETTAQTFWLGQQADGSFSDTVRFEVAGSGLENVELVSAKDESVIYGRFTISADQTRAILDWEYLAFQGWAYSTYEVRVLAWNAPPGESGRSIEVMAPRTYYNKLPLGCQGEGTCGGSAP